MRLALRGKVTEDVRWYHQVHRKRKLQLTAAVYRSYNDGIYVSRSSAFDQARARQHKISCRRPQHDVTRRQTVLPTCVLSCLTDTSGSPITQHHSATLAVLTLHTPRCMVHRAQARHAVDFRRPDAAAGAAKMAAAAASAAYVMSVAPTSCQNVLIASPAANSTHAWSIEPGKAGQLTRLSRAQSSAPGAPLTLPRAQAVLRSTGPCRPKPPLSAWPFRQQGSIRLNTRDGGCTCTSLVH